MYSIDKYYKEALLLSNSLVLKIPEIALAMNRGLYRNYGIKVTEDKLSWIYYQNLAGIKHPTNKDIIITYLENNESAPLTKERMLNSPLTRKTLLGAGDKFKELCATYPGEEVYIRGCLYNIDIKTAINAPAGTILGYNKCLVETQEYSFIPELQEYIYNDFVTLQGLMDFLLINPPYNKVNHQNRNDYNKPKYLDRVDNNQ